MIVVEAPIADRLTMLGLVQWGDVHALGDSELDALLGSRPHEGLVCLLGAAVERGLVVVDASPRQRIAAAWADVMARAVQLDMLLLQVTAALDSAGIDSRVLKGVANATLDEADPSWRSYNDVDVLIPSDRLVAAAETLGTLGLQPIAAPVGRRWAERNTKSLTLQDGNGMQVDLHRMLAAGPFGARIRPSALFEHGRTFDVGGTQLTALSDTHRFLHACYHAALGGVRGVRHRRDVLLLASVTDPADVGACRSDGWSTVVVAAAVRWADEGVDVLGPQWAAWLESAVPDAADVELLAAYGGSFRGIARVELRATQGTLAKLGYAAALVWPSRANLAARGKTRWQHLRGLVGTSS